MSSRYNPDPDDYPDVPEAELKEAVRRLSILDAPNNLDLREPSDNWRKIKRWGQLHLKYGLRGLMARRYWFATRQRHGRRGRPALDEESVERIRRHAIRTCWGSVKLSRALMIPEGTVENYLRKMGLTTRKARLAAHHNPKNAALLKEEVKGG